MAEGTLFTRDFLERGICETREWNELDDKVVADFKATVGEIFHQFPHDTKPNESQTEEDLIWKVLVALGWDHSLRQQNLSSKGRENVPDGLLFADEEAKARANARHDEYQRYADGLAIVESKRWARLLDREDARKGDDIPVPSTQMLRYLRRVDDRTDGKLRWGILTNGRDWRLYWQGAKSVSEDFLALDLPVLAGNKAFSPTLFDGDPNHYFKVFLLMFRRDAFIPSELIDGRTFHQLALDEGRYWEARVAADLSDLVFRHVFPALVRSVVANDSLRPKPLTEEYLEEAKDASLILLYRILFILFAEDRNLLPARESRYDDYGMHKKVREEIAGRIDESDTFAASIGHYYAHMRQLFRAISKGEPSLGLPPYNGGLFDEERTPILGRAELPDADFAPVIDALSRHDEKGRKRRINYRDLSVQQIGSIYERLLEFEVRAGEDGVTVEDDNAARKGSGSYYTPEEPVQFIIGKTVGPLLDDRMLEFMERAEALAHDKRSKEDRLRELGELDPASRFLEIKVCDPAMGSGHFLVSLVDYMADRVLEAMAEATETVDWADPETPYLSPLANNIANIRRHILDQAEKGKWVLDEAQLDDRQVVRRMILKRVVYGVDKNPMAVELAKVSLWLHTFTVGAPLSFLEHHLRCGDSVAGEWVRPVEDDLAARGAMFLNRSVAQAKQAAKGMAKVERLTDTDIAEVRTSTEAFQDVEETTAPLAGFLDIVHARRWREKKDKSEESAFQALLDGQFGDPVRIAAGLDSIVLPEGVDELSLLPVEKSDQDSLLPGVPRDYSLYRTFAGFLKDARALADRENFLHWQVAFPGVWDEWESAEPTGGFDAVIGNPPYVRQELLGPMKPYLKQAYDSFHGMADLYVYFYELGLKILKPGGRLSYIVTNKWMKAGYGEPLRRMFAEKAWMETVVDFGHAKQIFKDADVFPSVIVARRPDKTDKPKKVNVCIIPRDILRMDDLTRQVGELSFAIDRNALKQSAWQLEPPEVTQLLAKISAGGKSLTEYTHDKPYRGLLTGLNEAFVIDTLTRDQLVSKDSKAAEIIKPFLRGQDMARWHAPLSGYWMIVLRSSENHHWPWSDSDTPEEDFRRTFPSLHEHLKKFEEKLKKRQDKGRYWWELRSCSYYEKFDLPKIIYQEITWRPQFCLDETGSLLVNTAYFLPIADRWLVAVMNSPLGWWFAWRNAQHGKDEALRFIGTFMEKFPIPKVDSKKRLAMEGNVGLLSQYAREHSDAERSILDWLKIEYQIHKPNRKLLSVFELTSDEFVLTVRDARGIKNALSPAALKSLREEYARSIEPMRLKAAEAGRLERELSDLVNQAYGLTPAEIDLMWRTAPPRMPLAEYYAPDPTEELKK